MKSYPYTIASDLGVPLPDAVEEDNRAPIGYNTSLQHLEYTRKGIVTT